MISDYLKDFADTPHRKHPEPSPEIIELLRKKPDESFNVIEKGLFQKPENLDPRDFYDQLCRLLITFADLIPNLLIPKMTNGFWGARYLYISSAAASKSPIFVPTIIDLLTDRSIYIKTLVLQLIVQWSHLQIPEAMPKFDKLSKMKSFQNSQIDRELLAQARQCVVSNL